MAQFGPIAILNTSTSVYRISEKGQWASLFQQEQIDSLLKDSKAMDSFFGMKYHRLCRRFQFEVGHPHLMGSLINAIRFTRRVVRKIKR